MARSQTIHVNNGFSTYEIGKGLQYYSTPADGLSIQQILNDTVLKKFIVNPFESLLLHEKEYLQDLWIHFSLVNTGTEVQPLVIELNNSLINHIDYYEIKNNTVLKTTTSGDAYDIATRMLNYRNFIYPVLLEPGDSRSIFMKFNLDGRKIHLPLTVYRNSGFINHIAKKEMGLGIYYGLLIMITVLFLYMSYLIRDKAFLWFAGYMMAHALLQLSISGTANIYLWGTYPFWADRCVAFFMAASMVLGLGFVTAFIKKEKFKGYQLLFIRIFQVASFVIALSSLSNTFSYSIGVWILYRLIPPFYFLMFFVALAFFIRSYMPARVFIIGYIGAIISISGIFYFVYLKKHGNIFTNNVVIAGEMIKCAVLSMALLDRLKIFKEEKEKAQSRLIEQLEELNTYKERINSELEDKVNEKSKELIEKQNEVKRALIHGEEKERRRVAQELHDGMGSLLSTLRLNAESIDLSGKKLTEKEATAYQNVLEMIDRACNDLRSISHNMLPSGIEHFGLIASLESLIKKINHNADTRFSLDTFGVGKKLGKETELHIYRITLELINNIIKHAQASTAIIQLIQQDQHLSIIVEDNGSGFNDENQDNEGVGLISVRTRVEALNGKIFIDSKKGHGTTISIEIPIDRITS